jgi:probable blue pigment (indigoidine) exporter
MNWKLIATGIVFAFLWSSASTATKFGLQSAQPFVIAVSRFFIAGAIMLFITHVIMRKPLPEKRQWLQLGIYGLLNISIYLGLYVIAMQKISAGLGSLAVAVNPVMISFIAAALFGHRITVKNISSLLLCSLGVLVAAYPLLQNSYASIDGIFIMLASMLAYSAGAIYYSKTNWGNLDIIMINGWQTILGGIFLLPVLLATYQPAENIFDLKFFGAICWLAIPVSIGAVQCWMVLLNSNSVKAAYWLFLCPVFGFFIASILLKEPIGIYTIAGVALVITGLYIAQKIKSTSIDTIVNFKK